MCVLEEFIVLCQGLSFAELNNKNSSLNTVYVVLIGRIRINLMGKLCLRRLHCLMALNVHSSKNNGHLKTIKQR